MSKYNAKKHTAHGIQFDSKMEGDYYKYLWEERKAGNIKDFTLQPTYELQPKFYKRDKLFRAITYKADFEVTELDGTIVTIDVKGFETADFKIKKKMFEYKYPQELRLVTFSKIDGGWIESEDLKEARKKRKLQKDIDKLTKEDIVGNRDKIVKMRKALKKLDEK